MGLWTWLHRQLSDDVDDRTTTEQITSIALCLTPQAEGRLAVLYDPTDPPTILACARYNPRRSQGHYFWTVRRVVPGLYGDTLYAAMADDVAQINGLLIPCPDRLAPDTELWQHFDANPSVRLVEVPGGYGIVPRKTLQIAPGLERHQAAYDRHGEDWYRGLIADASAMLLDGAR